MGDNQTEVKETGQTISLIPDAGRLFEQFWWGAKAEARSLIEHLPEEIHGDFHTVLHGILMALLCTVNAEEQQTDYARAALIQNELQTLVSHSSEMLAVKRDGEEGDGDGEI